MISKDLCCGCGACIYVCPTGAIRVKQDEEGFYCVLIDEEKCIGCNKCERVCPELLTTNIRKDYPKCYYGVRNKNTKILFQSSSGGAFYGLAKCIIESNGAVYGVKMDESDLEVVYDRADSMEGVALFIGSKYVQARLDQGMIVALLEDIREGRSILFSGTPCLVQGMKSLIIEMGLPDSNVIWLDFICAGVLSPYLWEREIKAKTCSLDDNVIAASFRDKTTGWRNYGISFSAANGKRLSDVYHLSNIGLLHMRIEANMRMCTSCKSRDLMRFSDITLGDFWNEEYLPKKWWDNLGTTLLLVNTDKGEDLLRKCDTLEMVSVERKAAEYGNLSNTISHDDIVRSRKAFWTLCFNDYKRFIDTYCHVGVVDKIIYKVLRPFLINSRIMTRYRHWKMLRKK